MTRIVNTAVQITVKSAPGIRRAYRYKKEITVDIPSPNPNIYPLSEYIDPMK